MRITQEQKRKIFEELLIDEELHDEACDNFDRQYWGSISLGVRKVVKILGLYDEYKAYKENKQRSE